MTEINVDKDALIDSLQEELATLGRQIGEFNDLRMSIVTGNGKNTVRKLKSKVLMTSDRVNGHCIGTYLRRVLWPDVKMMPSKQVERTSKEYLSASTQFGGGATWDDKRGLLERCGCVLGQ